MHELSVAEELLARASEAAADHGADTVETLTVELGVATHVNPTQLRLCLETVAETRGHPDLTVEIESVDLVGECVGFSAEWHGQSLRIVLEGLAPAGSSVSAFSQPLRRECLAAVRVTVPTSCDTRRIK